MKLCLDSEEGRHYLDGKPVHCGSQLLLRVTAGPVQEAWVFARYEADSGDSIRVTLHTCFGIVLPTRETELKWPNGGSR